MTNKQTNNPPGCTAGGAGVSLNIAMGCALFTLLTLEGSPLVAAGSLLVALIAAVVHLWSERHTIRFQ